MTYTLFCMFVRFRSTSSEFHSISPLVRVNRDRGDAAFADAVINVAQKEMDVLVRVNVPIPADEICERLERFGRLLIIEFDGGNEEIARLDVVRREPFSRGERLATMSSTMSCGSIWE